MNYDDSNKINWFSPFIILLIFTHLLSCTQWRVLKQPYAEQIEKKKPKKILLITNEGRSIILKYPSIDSDSLSAIYERFDSVNSQRKIDTLHVALKDIKSVQMAMANPGVILLICCFWAGVIALFYVGNSLGSGIGSY